MIKIKGLSVSGGIAIGKMFFIKHTTNIAKQNVSDYSTEVTRYKEAADKVISDLERIEKDTADDIGHENAQIFEIHKMMIQDKDFTSMIENMIKENSVNAEYAVEESAKSFCEMLEKTGNEYMMGRQSDIKDISRKLIAALTGDESETDFESLTDVIICADDLSPSETVKFTSKNIKGFVTKYGSAQSHTAILAKSMNIPAVIGTGSLLSDEYGGCTAVLDGYNGALYVDPTFEVLEDAKARLLKDTEHQERLRRLKGLDNITKDGVRIQLYANIGSVSDIGSVLENDAGGIGLFRSEFLYLKGSRLPNEDEQFKAYKEVLSAMKGKKVIIRTLDIGADKNAEYLNLEKEDNPAMGMRAIRLCLERPEIFKTQLRALLRASIYGKLSIMLPMIISTNEIRSAMRILDDAKAELRAEGIDFDNEIDIGIMIETPAAVMISDQLAREVDFFSIGTNDLTQYCLAIDRQNRQLESSFDSHHLAVLRMIKQTVDNAHRARIWCGICGELAADLSLTETFLNMGIDELSVSPSSILPLREKIRGINVESLRERTPVF